MCVTYTLSRDDCSFEPIYEYFLNKKSSKMITKIWEMFSKNSSHTNPKYKDDRFHLNNLSFAGPVVLGIGGKVTFNSKLYTCTKARHQSFTVP